MVPSDHWSRASIGALRIGELPFDSRPSNARARRCNQTCRAAYDPIAPDLAERRGRVPPESPSPRQPKSQRFVHCVD